MKSYIPEKSEIQIECIKKFDSQMWQVVKNEKSSLNKSIEIIIISLHGRTFQSLPNVPHYENQVFTKKISISN